MNTRTYIDLLPTELIFIIASYLSEKDKLAFLKIFAVIQANYPIITDIPNDQELKQYIDNFEQHIEKIFPTTRLLDFSFSDHLSTTNSSLLNFGYGHDFDLTLFKRPNALDKMKAKTELEQLRVLYRNSR